MAREAGPVAVVDLGSNSFHMVIARVRDGRIQVVDRLREPVRIGGGLDARGRLAAPAQARALDCLQRFGQRLQRVRGVRVRAVGTNALRCATGAATFLARAERALGHPIEVISGREEARLIYLGVAFDLAETGGRRLVVDVGGGSTELIIGEGRKPIECESVSMGCVSWSERFLGGGRVTPHKLESARTAALIEVQPIVEQLRRAGWSEVIGASGTVRAIRDVAVAHGWSDGAITADALDAVWQALCAQRRVDFRGLSPDRGEIFAGGVAILSALFKALQIDRMEISEMALREGLLYDLVGRRTAADVRDHAVTTLAKIHAADAVHADEVERIAVDAFGELARRWRFADEHRNWLRWAARVHEIGVQISHSQYHKHGAYILQHSDMPGFSRQEQDVLAALVRAHRRKFDPALFDTLPPDWSQVALRLALLLRLAVLLRRAGVAPKLAWRATADGLSVTFPTGWLKRHSLATAELQAERATLATAGFRLSFR